MKKTVSISLAVLILAAAFVFCSAPAWAESTVHWAVRENPQDTLGYVNDQPSDDVQLTADPATGGCKITYTGKGTVTGWSFPLSKSGEDYKILSQGDKSITVRLLREDQALPYVQAHVRASQSEGSTRQKTKTTAKQRETATKVQVTQTVPATVVASGKKNTTETTGAKVTDIETTATLQAKQETKDKKSRKIGVSLTVAGIVCILAVGGYMVKKYSACK